MGFRDWRVDPNWLGRLSRKWAPGLKHSQTCPWFSMPTATSPVQSPDSCQDARRSLLVRFPGSRPATPPLSHSPTLCSQGEHFKIQTGCWNVFLLKTSPSSPSNFRYNLSFPAQPARPMWSGSWPVPEWIFTHSLLYFVPAILSLFCDGKLPRSCMCTQMFSPASPLPSLVILKVSKDTRWTSSISVTCKLVKNVNSWTCSRPAELEALGVAPSNIFNESFR